MSESAMRTSQYTTTPTSKSGEVAERGKEVAEKGREEARAVMHDARYQAQRLASDAREQMRSQAAQQTDRLAQTLRDVSGQLQSMLRGEPSSGMVNDMTRQLADTTDRFATRLQDGGFDRTMGDLRGFARNHPGMFLLGAFGVGLAAGRLLKAADTHSLVDAAKPSSHNGHDGHEWRDDYDEALGTTQTGYSTTQTSYGTTQRPYTSTDDPGYPSRGI